MVCSIAAIHGPSASLTSVSAWSAWAMAPIGSPEFSRWWAAHNRATTAASRSDSCAIAPSRATVPCGSWSTCAWTTATRPRTRDDVGALAVRVEQGQAGGDATDLAAHGVERDDRGG